MQFHKGTIVSTFHSFMLQSLIIDVKKNVLEADFDQLLQPIKINFIYNWRMHSCQLRFSRKKLRGNLNFMPVWQHHMLNSSLLMNHMADDKNIEERERM